MDNFVEYDQMKVIAYRPELVSITGSPITAILLGQLIWLSRNTADNNGWFERSRDELQADTGLSHYQQRNAIDKLSQFVEFKQGGRLPCTKYRIKENNLSSTLRSFFSSTSRNCTPQSKETTDRGVKVIQDTRLKKPRTLHKKDLKEDSIREKISPPPQPKPVENPNWTAEDDAWEKAMLAQLNKEIEEYNARLSYH